MTKLEMKKHLAKMLVTVDCISTAIQHRMDEIDDEEDWRLYKYSCWQEKAEEIMDAIRAMESEFETPDGTYKK